MRIRSHVCAVAIFLAPNLAAAEEGSARAVDAPRQAIPRGKQPVPAKPAIRPTAAPATPASASTGIALTLADAIAIGLRDNRTIRSAYIDRIAQKFDLRVAEDRFTPQFSIGGGAVQQRVAGISTTSAEVTPAATVLLPTGATFGFSWVNTVDDSAGIRNRSSTAEMALVQPLLRGGGLDVNTAPVKTA